jgi:hypothetical protein
MAATYFFIQHSNTMKGYLILLLISGLICQGACNSDSEPTPKPDIDGDPAGAPPKKIQENWLSHTQALTRVFYDDDVAIYFDGDMDTTIKWMNKYVGDAWRYTKKTYGGHGPDGRLYAFFHAGKYGGGHAGYYYSDVHGHRNVIDCGGGLWLTQSASNVDLITHEIFHIVESTSFNSKGSAGYGYPDGIWGDSKYAEIFQYDVYRGLNMESHIERWYTKVNTVSDNFPKSDTYWFRDWLYPFYHEHGETAALTKFFKLLADYFPKDANNMYTRRLNWGEFVHFSSGAADADLKELASNAFGWSEEWEAQWTQAKKDFPAVTY